MSDLTMEDEVGEELEELSRTRVGGKRIILLILVPIILVLAAGGGLYFTGMLDGLLGNQPAQTAEQAGGAEGEGEEAQVAGAVFLDLEDMLVNLNTEGRQPRFLKISISLELERQSDLNRVQQLMPRVRDEFQTYLRELRVEDLNGSAGIYRLRTELLSRVSQATFPARVRSVLFREVLIQ
ncbi:MAG: flagellar basal body-associated FliL family protein [Pseudomonadota bacterium]